MIFASSPPTLDAGPDLLGHAVLVVEDGPTLTHGGMPFGAGLVAARRRVRPGSSTRGRTRSAPSRRPSRGGRSCRACCRPWATPTSSSRELEQTINAIDCDVVITGTPIDLGRLISSRHPIRHVRYELEELGSPTLADVLAPIVTQARAALRDV